MYEGKEPKDDFKYEHELESWDTVGDLWLKANWQEIKESRKLNSILTTYEQGSE